MAFTVSGSPWDSGTVPSPAYSGTFIPEVWSGKLIEKFYDASVIPAIANTDYEGEISSYGDKVTIRQVPDVTINTYDAEQALTFERPSAAVVELLIDQGKYFATILDDVYERQADIDQVSLWASDASEQMKISIDTEVLAAMKTGGALQCAATTNRGATAGAVSANVNLGAAGTNGDACVDIIDRSPAAGDTEFMDLVLRMGQVLDEQNVPESGRWMVINPWMARLIKGSELRDASLSGDGTSMLRNGRLGRLDRFTLYSTNHLPTTTEGTATVTHLFAGHRNAITFASQLDKMETLRAESTFGNIMRGLQVYGRKTINPKFFCEAWVTAGARA